MQRAILLHAPLVPGLAPRWAPSLLQALPYGKRLELERRPSEACLASLSGLALAFTAVARLVRAPCAVRALEFAEGGKPRFAQGPSFSVSHTQGHVCAVVAGGDDVGVDVERVLGAAADLDRLRRWTAIEATLKAAGLGLPRHGAVQLARDFANATLQGTRYALRPWAPAADATGHVASRGPIALEIDALDLAGAEVSAAVERALGLAPELEQ